MIKLRYFIVVAIALGFAATTRAAIDAAEFESEDLRQRYQTLVSEMRCPKCQNQNLAGSDSPIAGDLRREIRRLLHEGSSDEQIADYLVTRYGDFVLYRPRWQSATYALWFTPFVLFFVAIIIWLWVVRSRVGRMGPNSTEENSHSTQLSLEEQAALNKVLTDDAFLEQEKP